jgi:hypothetical protein
MRLTTDYLVLRLRMCGAIPSLPLCTFMACIGKTSPSFFSYDTVSYARRKQEITDKI